MPIYKIQKRNGTIVDFDLKKIESAIAGAAKSVGNTDTAIPFTLAKEVHIRMEEHFHDDVPNVEGTQDIVEEVLVQYGYADIAKSYILDA